MTREESRSEELRIWSHEKHNETEGYYFLVNKVTQGSDTVSLWDNVPATSSWSKQPKVHKNLSRLETAGGKWLCSTTQELRKDVSTVDGIKRNPLNDFSTVTDQYFQSVLRLIKASTTIKNDLTFFCPIIPCLSLKSAQFYLCSVVLS